MTGVTPAIFALIISLSSGGNVTIERYHEYRNCTTARDALRLAMSYIPDSRTAECKMIKFGDVIYEDSK